MEEKQNCEDKREGKDNENRISVFFFINKMIANLVQAFNNI